MCVCWGGVTQNHTPLTYNCLVVSGGGSDRGGVMCVWGGGGGGVAGWCLTHTYQWRWKGLRVGNGGGLCVWWDGRDVSDAYLPMEVEGTWDGGGLCV